jgi:hypothetical protein
MGRVSRVLKYAVAAVVIGIIAMGSVFFFNNDADPVVVSTFNPAEIKKLSDQEIIEYLKTNSFADVNPVNPVDLQQDVEYESFLDDLSEKDIEEYLKENPEPVEIHSKEG